MNSADIERLVSTVGVPCAVLASFLFIGWRVATLSAPYLKTVVERVAACYEQQTKILDDLRALHQVDGHCSTVRTNRALSLLAEALLAATPDDKRAEVEKHVLVIQTILSSNNSPSK